MHGKLMKILPRISLIGFVITVACLVFLQIKRSEIIFDSPENRQRGVKYLEQLRALNPDSINDPQFLNKVDETINASHIASIWVYDDKGKCIVSKGSTANQVSIQDRATDEIKRVLKALPVDALTIRQVVLILAASAISAEGEHNDIYRHLVQEIENKDGEVVSIVGIAYNLLGSTGPSWKTVIILGLLSIILYWLSLPLWVYLDARQRGERARIWAIFVLIGNLVALIAYLLVRQSATDNSVSGNE